MGGATRPNSAATSQRMKSGRRCACLSSLRLRLLKLPSKKRAKTRPHHSELAAGGRRSAHAQAAVDRRRRCRRIDSPGRLRPTQRPTLVPAGLSVAVRQRVTLPASRSRTLSALATLSPVTFMATTALPYEHLDRATAGLRAEWRRQLLALDVHEMPLWATFAVTGPRRVHRPPRSNMVRVPDNGGERGPSTMRGTSCTRPGRW
jgi:hypothetical protein